MHHFRRDFDVAQVNPDAAGEPVVVPKMVDFTESTRTFQYDELQQFKQSDGCVDRRYLWHRFPTGDSNTNRNYEVFRGGRSEPLAEASGPLRPFEDRHASTQA